MQQVVRSFARILFGKILPRVAYKVMRGPLRGSRFILGSNGGEGGGATVYFNMVEPLQTEAFIKYIKNGCTLFDVGANVGYYTVLGSKLTGVKGKVFSFEPLVRNISYLHKHVEINKLNNVTIVPCACSDSLSLVTFFQSANTAMGRIENSEIDGTSNTIMSLVPTISLDGVAEKLNIQPDVIKIDVEGAEMAVLKGAQNIINTGKPIIFLSVHSAQLRIDCKSYLANFGYSLKPLEADIENSMEYLCIPSKNASEILL